MTAALLHRSVLRAHELFTGRHILDRLEGLLQTQWLDRDALMALQRAKLQRVIDYAYQYVPYYQRTFDATGFSPDELREDLDALRKLPALTKAIIRDNFSDMMTTEPQRRQKLSRLATSGSTGHSLVFMQDSDFRDCVTADGLTVWAGFAGSAYRCLTHPRIKQFQVVQKTLDWLIVRPPNDEL